MKARAMFSTARMVAPDEHQRVFASKEVELPDDFFTLEGEDGWTFVGLNDFVKGEPKPEKLVKDEPPRYDHLDVDHVLAIGRRFQNEDTWHGAHWDTVKLLCDTIEAMNAKIEKLEAAEGTRNCDVYPTFEQAREACFRDREYCSSPIDERESVIRFMLQDVKDNPSYKNTCGKDDANASHN